MYENILSLQTKYTRLHKHGRQSNTLFVLFISTTTQRIKPKFWGIPFYNED